MEDLPSSNHHGPPKVNFWQDLMNPFKWKEEHFVISLIGWGLLLYGGYKIFTRGKEKRVLGAAIHGNITKGHIRKETEEVSAGEGLNSLTDMRTKLAGGYGRLSDSGR
ncbi:hypothetical protein QN277_023079 [Acacia crassicarpa]|uniref:Uncharacterized protein n=1 Tax=Acacia crassicarpa TaxID=499986 RepID=A0AAE1KAT7_9FABA|nr:hypothetical protein QN277_023079 [Acacia crassicarpa]